MKTPGQISVKINTPQFRGSEFPAFNRKELGQHPSAPPLSSRRWFGGI
jgi:hypothetical protein